jgi:transmembrane sensor
VQKGNVLVKYSFTMKSNKMQNIIVKYLSNQATFAELDELDKWVKNPENEKLFQSYIRTNYAIDYNVKKFNSDKIKLMLAMEIAKEKKVFRLKKIRQRIFYMAAASVVIGVLATGFFFKDSSSNKPSETMPVLVNNTIQPGTDKATLTLEDGTIVQLSKGNNFKTNSANSNGEEIVYVSNNPNSANVNKPSYNYLTIPRGGQFHLVLADGTAVWLNSETQLKYPVAFQEGNPRQVELVYGEAYFEVSPSTAHKGARFVVVNKKQEVEVVGTKFNIKAYKDEFNIYTTLVEGKVDVNIGTQKQRLIPNQQLNLDLSSSKTQIQTVDVNSIIAWKDGVFSFKGKTLKEIMKVIGRWYDVDVVFENKKLETLTFRGSIEKKQPLEEILSIMKSNTINSYEYKNKTIILK